MMHWDGHTFFIVKVGWIVVLSEPLVHFDTCHVYPRNRVGIKNPSEQILGPLWQAVGYLSFSFKDLKFQQDSIIAFNFMFTPFQYIKQNYWPLTLW